MHPARALVLPLVLLASAACSDPNELPPASIENREDTLTLGALRGTPISMPSAFAVDLGAVRTDQTSNFDFAYDVDDAGRHVFLPRGLLDLAVDNSIKPGVQPVTQTFDSIRVARSDGYITGDTVPVLAGERYIVRSRLVCSLGVPQYAKLEILSLDDVARAVTLRVLTNNNCGYRGLRPGLPRR